MKLRHSRFLAAVILFLLVDGLTFRTGFYNRYLEPNSAAGVFKEAGLEAINCLSYEKRAQPSNPRHVIAYMGDSRTSEGFSEKIFDEIAEPISNYKAVSLAMPGSTPRIWYYFLKDFDKHNNAFSAIVLPLPSYDFAAIYPYGDPADRELDLKVLLPVLTTTQLFDLAQTCNSSNLKLKIWLSAIIFSLPYQNDICDFISNPAQRLSRLKEQKTYAGSGVYNYKGNDASLEGFVVADHRLISAPPNAPPKLKEDVEAGLEIQRVSPEFKLLEKRYLKYWLNRILDKYKNSPTKIIFVRIPSDPFRIGLAEQPGELISSLISRPNVIVLDSNLFTAFEKPEYFDDFLHMDSKARIGYSYALTEKLLEVLPPSSKP